jgi:hypothetical protein
MIGNTSRAPIDHLRSWIQRQAGAFVRLERWDDNLACGKAMSVWSEFSDFLLDVSMDTVWMPARDVMPTDSWAHLACLAVIEQACDFYRRVVVPSTEYPHKLFVLVHSKPFEICQDRRRVASDLLSAPADRIDSQVTAKFRDIFRDDIEIAATTGVFTERAFEFLRDVSAIASIDPGD